MSFTSHSFFWRHKSHSQWLKSIKGGFFLWILVDERNCGPVSAILELSELFFRKFNFIGFFIGAMLKFLKFSFCWAFICILFRTLVKLGFKKQQSRTILKFRLLGPSFLLKSKISAKRGVFYNNFFLKMHFFPKKF